MPSLSPINFARQEHHSLFNRIFRFFTDVEFTFSGDASSYLILEEEHARSGAKREATRSRDDSFSRLSHHTWELMNSLDDKLESPKLRKLIISSLNSNVWAKPDLNRIVDRLSGSALKLEEDYELVRV
ncbi:hypothetical protein YC2023_105591 [Brassica napus]